MNNVKHLFNLMVYQTNTNMMNINNNNNNRLDL